MNMQKTHEHAHRDDWLSAKQAAELLPETSRRSVQNWCKAGRLDGAIRLPSGQWRIPLKSIEALLEPPAAEESA